MKKYLYNIVLATLILMSTTVVNAANEVYYINRNNIQMTEEEYNNLLSLGFTEKYIDVMDEQEFLDNKDIEATLLSTSTKYYKTTTTMRNGIKLTTTQEITEEEATIEKELQSQGIPNRGPAGNYYDGVISTNTFAITTIISGIGNTYMRFTNNVEWFTIPSDRYYDIIGIGIEADKVQRATGIVFNQHWVRPNGESDHDDICAPKYVNTGSLAAFKLPEGSIQTYYMSAYFNVMKQPNVGTVTTLYAVGDYAHAINNVTPDNLMSHISISDSFGIMIDSTYGTSFVDLSPAVASFVGTW